MPHRARTAIALIVALTFTHVASGDSPTEATDKTAAGCFSVGGGYLRARMRGALDLDLKWKNAEMQCQGGPRPSGNGVRVSIGGPAGSDGHRIRLVFGVAGIAEGGGGKNLRTNLTIL